MNTSRKQSALSGWRRRAIPLALVCLAALLTQGCDDDDPKPVEAPQAFKTPEEAVGVLTSAVREGDTRRLVALVGSEGEDLVESGDEVADRNRRQEFLTLYDEKHSLEKKDDVTMTLVVGNSEWPFPVPLVRTAAGWVFDASVGREEILNRRIGGNELAAIQVCRAVGDAQREYALRDPDGNGVHEYAQKFFSDAGKRDGLYWPTAEGETPSPAGEMVSQAAAHGYTRKEQGPTPYHGYFYRILQAQGSHAPGGALDYVVNGKMILGFAVVAWPADYENSGIMTFIMGPDGVVYQKDLGEKTAEIARNMKVFDPGEGWTQVADQPPADAQVRASK